jgi:hypothetical protein
LQAFLLGCIAQVMFDYNGQARKRWLRFFSYTRTAAAIACIGAICIIPLIMYYLSHRERLSLSATTVQDHLAVVGLMSIIIGFSLFTFTLVLHGAAIATRRSPRR